jgi:hypothetical protein
MCTVTFIARRHGFVLGMNRDEQLTRVTAIPPSIRILGRRQAICPAEPGGGTWVGVNDAGISCALINWYAVKSRVTDSAASRGTVVTAALAAGSLPEMGASLAGLPLDRVNPFRLIGVFADSSQVIEWRWNLKRLTTVSHPWKTASWASSGHDEAGAQTTRGRTFDEALRQKSAGSLAWLRRLHRCHQPARGPYSICMHREDAATVSYTEIIVSSEKTVIRYRAGAPCDNARFKTQRLGRHQPG